MILRKKLIAVPKELINDERLTNGERFLYIVLAAISDGESVNFKWSDVAKIMGRTISTTRKYMKRLLMEGWCSFSDEEGYMLNSEKK